MKGIEAIIDTLNALLADELTTINQYMVTPRCATTGGTRCWRKRPKTRDR